MTLALTLNALHVLTAFVLVSGVVGRGIALQEAARARDIRVVDALVGLAGRFEVMARVPSIVVLLLGLLTAWRGGWPILGFLQGGSVNWILASLVLYATLAPLIIWVFLPKGRIFARILASRARTSTRVCHSIHDPCQPRWGGGDPSSRLTKVPSRRWPGRVHKPVPVPRQNRPCSGLKPPSAGLGVRRPWGAHAARRRPGGECREPGHVSTDLGGCPARCCLRRRAP
jgi:Predicted integral membrane protein (DUF2269)